MKDDGYGFRITLFNGGEVPSLTLFLGGADGGGLNPLLLAAPPQVSAFAEEPAMEVA